MLGYNENAMSDALTCAKKADSYLEDLLTKIKNANTTLSTYRIPDNYMPDANNTLKNTLNICNEAIGGGSSSSNSSIIAYLKGYMDDLCNIETEEAKSYRLYAATVADLSKYKEDPSQGFELYFSDKKFSLDDFANSIEAQKLGYTAEEALEVFIAVIIAESDKTVDDALAVASVALNRCEYSNWVSRHGDNIFDSMFYEDGKNWTPVHKDGSDARNRFKDYLVTERGLEAVEKSVSAHGNASYEELRETIMTALEDGLRNNDYTGYRAGNDGAKISDTGNAFRYEVEDYELSEAQERKASRTPLDKTYKPTGDEMLDNLFKEKTSNDNEQYTFGTRTETPEQVVPEPEQEQTVPEQTVPAPEQKAEEPETKPEDKKQNPPSGDSGGYSGGGGSSGGGSTKTSKAYILTIKYVYAHNPSYVVYTETKTINAGDAYNYTPRVALYYNATPGYITGVMPENNIEVLITYVPVNDINGNGRADEEENLVQTKPEEVKETIEGNTTSKIVNNYYYGSSTKETEVKSDLTELENELESIEPVEIVEPIVEPTIEPEPVEIVPEIHPHADPNLVVNTNTNNKNIWPVVGVAAGVTAAAVGAKVLLDKDKKDDNDEYTE